MDNFEDIEFLSQPLLTDEGFVNPACMNELAAVINNMPPTYERLANEPEWSTKEITSLTDILGALAKYAVIQSPYACPEDLAVVIRYADACLHKDISWKDYGDCWFASLSLCDINKALFHILMDFEPFRKWNEPRFNWRKDPNLKECPQNPDYDFIDLHALLHNVCLDIRTERREWKKFNDEFDAKYGNLKED